MPKLQQLNGQIWVDDRPATDTETQIVLQALKIVSPFSDYVNIASIGNTPEEALRREFGLI